MFGPVFLPRGQRRHRVIGGTGPVSHPLLLENRKGCSNRAPTFLKGVRARESHSPQLAHVVDGLDSYALKDQRRYIPLVDGGISDNLRLPSTK